MTTVYIRVQTTTLEETQATCSAAPVISSSEGRQLRVVTSSTEVAELTGQSPATKGQAWQSSSPHQNGRLFGNDQSGLKLVQGTASWARSHISPVCVSHSIPFRFPVWGRDFRSQNYATPLAQKAKRAFKRVLCQLGPMPPSLWPKQPVHLCFLLSGTKQNNTTVTKLKWPDEENKNPFNWHSWGSEAFVNRSKLWGYTHIQVHRGMMILYIYFLNSFTSQGSAGKLRVYL